eukprot:scaffold139347_cov259-Phaeocystis_antarctica.AAC.1
MSEQAALAMRAVLLEVGRIASGGVTGRVGLLSGCRVPGAVGCCQKRQGSVFPPDHKLVAASL